MIISSLILKITSFMLLIMYTAGCDRQGLIFKYFLNMNNVFHSLNHVVQFFLIWTDVFKFLKKRTNFDMDFRFLSWENNEILTTMLVFSFHC